MHCLSAAKPAYAGLARIHLHALLDENYFS